MGMPGPLQVWRAAPDLPIAERRTLELKKYVQDESDGLSLTGGSGRGQRQELRGTGRVKNHYVRERCRRNA